jgi:hypothetical protein
MMIMTHCFAEDMPTKEKPGRSLQLRIARGVTMEAWFGHYLQRVRGPRYEDDAQTIYK